MSSKSALKALIQTSRGRLGAPGKPLLHDVTSQPEPGPHKERQAAANFDLSIDRYPALQDGGARRDRTDDLMLAKHPLYQLSYGPIRDAQESWSVTIVRDGRPGQTRTADLTLIRRTL
jgi:hypothetical protein